MQTRQNDSTKFEAKQNAKSSVEENKSKPWPREDDWRLGGASSERRVEQKRVFGLRYLCLTEGFNQEVI